MSRSARMSSPSSSNTEPTARRSRDARLIEPCGLLDGAPAAQAVRAGMAMPLAGGGGYTLARLIDFTGARLIPVTDLPEDWRDVADRLGAAPPAWAGLGDGPVVMGILTAPPDSLSDGGD